MSRMERPSELRSFWIRSSCSESLRFLSRRPDCSCRSPAICRVMYHEYVTTAASVMISPRSNARVGDRLCEGRPGTGANISAAPSQPPAAGSAVRDPGSANTRAEAGNWQLCYDSTLPRQCQPDTVTRPATPDSCPIPAGLADSRLDRNDSSGHGWRLIDDRR